MIFFFFFFTPITLLKDPSQKSEPVAQISWCSPGVLIRACSESCMLLFLGPSDFELTPKNEAEKVSPHKVGREETVWLAKQRAGQSGPTLSKS